MKSIQTIDNEYSTYLGDEIASINEFSGDFFIEIEHALMSGKIDVSIKNGKFIGVDNIGYFHTLDSDGVGVNNLSNRHIKLVSEIIEILPSLQDHIVEQSYKQYEVENE